MGDQEFLDAFSEHLDRLHNLARGLTACPQDAEDLVQETCLLALRGWRRRAPEDPAAWFATICLNTWRSQHRRARVRPVEVADEAWLAGRRDDAADTARSALAEIDAQGVRLALQALPAAQAEAIALMDLGGYTAAQTAAVTGVSRGTVLSRVHRGRKALAVRLLAEAGVRT